MWDPLLLADFRSLCNQRVCWPFIIMLAHRDDVKDRRYVVNVDHFQKANEFFIPVCADKFTSIQVSCEFSFYRFKIFPEVPEKSSVPYRCLIINPVDAFYKIIIKPYNFQDHTTFGRTPYILARLLGELFPPVVKASCRYCSPIIPFPMIMIFRRDLGWPLRKREDIGFQVACLQLANK